MGAHGTPTFWRRSSTPVLVRARVTAGGASKGSARWATRAGLSAKRGSRGRPGTPSASEAFAKSASDPAAIMTQASRGGNASYGRIIAGPEPWGWGTSPVPKYWFIWKTLQASAVSYSAVVTLAPRPGGARP